MQIAQGNFRDNLTAAKKAFNDLGLSNTIG
jgi:hypothetical protein